MAFTCSSKCKGCTALTEKKAVQWVVGEMSRWVRQFQTRMRVVSLSFLWHIYLFSLMLCSLGIHKLVIILYLQCGFNALSFCSVDTVDWGLFRIFFLSTRFQLQSIIILRVVRRCGCWLAASNVLGWSLNFSTVPGWISAICKMWFSSSLVLIST